MISMKNQSAMFRLERDLFKATARSTNEGAGTHCSNTTSGKSLGSGNQASIKVRNGLNEGQIDLPSTNAIRAPGPPRPSLQLLTGGAAAVTFFARFMDGWNGSYGVF